MKQVYSDISQDRIDRVKSLKAKNSLNRDFVTKLADHLTQEFGTAKVLIVHLIIFIGWIILNLGVLPGFHILDPFPFTFMTTILSIEAIVLTIFVLISQNRQTLIQDVREEVDLQINVHAEAEITKILTMLDEIRDHLKMRPKSDPELAQMERPINTDRITKELEKEIEESV
ncbi:hypothetical protein A2690_01295 [Candidatus Roizmanbacteria bacterium RIFCSPHIGHO2_01_FULL_39_12b]|uniref:DUF1003 domain-containing protein n=1 Tax=Candidatus Roizmanbacteria bacterium RIFCSPHIGHO2_01_FULL_39_12b TaxID=1802030 RepID=A0A1F7GAZ9_9BACT|nr:MAG: hypothetical protein A2690_01295 [Candidatus Roizmanbacteria bacterium RIFCSPHIGHO2_01_FULL_39_12b]OGK46077.1 MAG: hypothetical protein A3B46_01200 [Candidatus Roizmanbacteria bacterium RIFCSPLOWO2_01_FULL_39_19]